MEINSDEIYDPSHLSDEEQICIRNMIAAREAGVSGAVDDDPIVRGLVNGRIMDTICQSVEEPGYNEKKMNVQPEHTLTPEQTEQLLSTLHSRFAGNMKRHKVIEWSKVEVRLNEASPEKLWSLNEMERTGGEPDVVGFVEETGEYEFWDFSKESPKGRRNVCFDSKGQEIAEREGYNPKGNAVDMAAAMGLGGLLNRDQYENKLQKLGKFDKKSWSWIDTPEEIRKKGVALFAARSYDGVLVNEGSPDSHGDLRGFRGWLRV